MKVNGLQNNTKTHLLSFHGEKKKKIDIFWNIFVAQKKVSK